MTAQTMTDDSPEPSAEEVGYVHPETETQPAAELDAATARAWIAAVRSNILHLVGHIKRVDREYIDDHSPTGEVAERLAGTERLRDAVTSLYEAADQFGFLDAEIAESDTSALVSVPELPAC